MGMTRAPIKRTATEKQSRSWKYIGMGRRLLENVESKAGEILRKRETSEERIRAREIRRIGKGDDRIPKCATAATKEPAAAPTIGVTKRRTRNAEKSTYEEKPVGFSKYTL